MPDYMYQIWHETDVGPLFTTKQAAIDHINKEREDWGEEPYSEKEDYPDIRKFEVDTGFIDSKHKIEFMDR